MNKKDLLLEIGLEEMPARFVTDSMKQLGEKVEKWLQDNQIDYDGSELFSTPRRLAVLIHQVNEKQNDIDEEAKGPAKKIAQDKNGNWTKAALGFARGQGVEADDLYFKEVNGTDYVFVNKHIKGQATYELLSELKELILSLHFPKNMRWANNDLKYVRPIHWICALFGEEIIPINILNVKSDRMTFGHRFLGEQISIPTPSKYNELLVNQSVIADPVKRKDAIRRQLADMEKDKGWVIPVDEDLLEEVNNLVEYPTAVTGTFDPEFLNIPQEVLITSMKEHQRYFPVKDQKGALEPYFITIRNGNENHLANVAKGNEKVLRARLSDAQFFFAEDQKVAIDSSLEKLAKIVFHEDLGTVAGRVERVRDLAKHLAEMLQLNEEETAKVDRAAQISKFDLVTHIVYEFPELQGIMGEKYALIFGEDRDVAKAINEHYMPRSADDSVASTKIGATVSIADKLDTIVSFFGINLIPTGSQDPYALRRQASGVLQTLIHQSWNILLDAVIKAALKTNKSLGLLKREEEDIYKDLVSFFQLRIKNILQERNVRYDVIDSLLFDSIGNINEIVSKAEFLMDQMKNSEFKETVEALSRVTNIATKATNKQLDVSLFREEEEKNLQQVFDDMLNDFEAAMKSNDMTQAFKCLQSLVPAINSYFDNILVMAEDEQIRNNRLAQMAAIADVIYRFAKFNAIVFK